LWTPGVDGGFHITGMVVLRLLNAKRPGSQNKWGGRV
jgi:hypothetical protein